MKAYYSDQGKFGPLFIEPQIRHCTTCSICYIVASLCLTSIVQYPPYVSTYRWDVCSYCWFVSVLRRKNDTDAINYIVMHLNHHHIRSTSAWPGPQVRNIAKMRCDIYICIHASSLFNWKIKYCDGSNTLAQRQPSFNFSLEWSWKMGDNFI